MTIQRPLRCIVTVAAAAGCATTQLPPVDTDGGSDGSVIAKDAAVVTDAPIADASAGEVAATEVAANTCALLRTCSDASAPDCPVDPIAVARGQHQSCAEDGGICSYLGRCMPECFCNQGSWTCTVPAC